MSRQVIAQPLTYGQGQGEILKLDEPISYWGGIDGLTGIIGDIHHPQYGQSVVGKILALETSRGSSSGSYTLMELMRANLAPKAIVLSEPDGVTCTAVLVGQETYDLELPVILVPLEALNALKTGEIGKVVSETHSASITIN